MENLKDLYASGVNIMEYIRKANSTEANSLSAILASYDMQAGSYVQSLLNDETSDKFCINSVRTEMSHQKYLDLFTDELANEINKCNCTSILEAGVGEATTFVKLIKKLKNKIVRAKGFDISPSRIMVGKHHLETNSINNAELFVGGLEKIPFADNSFDIVYTVHAVEPNSNNEENIVKELYRVANKYLILVEPSYELGNELTKQNIEKHKYIKNLKRTIEELKYNILKYELFPVGTYSNQPAVTIIKKETGKETSNGNFCCPNCKTESEFTKGNYFCSKCNLVYPVLANIPILDVNRAIFFSQYAT